MTKILIAPDKFKGSLTAIEVCAAIAKGMCASTEGLDIRFHPMADGGDGSLDVIGAHRDLDKVECHATDPLGRPLSTYYYRSADTVFIELVSASGMVLLDVHEQNPLNTTTLGTGTMIKHALESGARQVYLFLGGSATNDAGIGILQALGFNFLDENQELLPPIGRNLERICHIRDRGIYDLGAVKFTLLCDVKNPMYGPEGAAYVYAAQKGADQDAIEQLDRGLRNFSKVIEQYNGVKVSAHPGTGAAGAIGAGMMALAGAELVKGFEALAALSGLEQHIRWADWVITGEGRLDGQSLEGKVVDGVTRLSSLYEKSVALFVGMNALKENRALPKVVKKIYALIDEAENLEDAMQNGEQYLTNLGNRFCSSAEFASGKI